MKMGLEDILERNPIVRRIKSLQDNNHELLTWLLNSPFASRNVTAKYPSNVLRIVETEKGSETRDAMLDVIIKNHLPSVGREQLVDHISNEHNHVGYLLYHLFMLYGGEVVDIKDFYRFAGRTWVRPDYKQIFAGRAIGTTAIYQLIPVLVPDYTDMIDMEHDAVSRPGHAVIFRRTKDKFRKEYEDIFGEFSRNMLEGDSLFSQGTLEGVPKAADMQNEYAKVKEEQFELDSKDSKCKYTVTWIPPPYEALTGVHLPEVSKHPRAILSLAKFAWDNRRGIWQGYRAARRAKHVFESPEGRVLFETVIKYEGEIQRRREAEKTRLEAEIASTVLRHRNRLLSMTLHSNIQGSRVVNRYLRNVGNSLPFFEGIYLIAQRAYDFLEQVYSSDRYDSSQLDTHSLNLIIERDQMESFRHNLEEFHRYISRLNAQSPNAVRAMDDMHTRFGMSRRAFSPSPTGDGNIKEDIEGIVELLGDEFKQYKIGVEVNLDRISSKAEPYSLYMPDVYSSLLFNAIDAIGRKGIKGKIGIFGAEVDNKNGRWIKLDFYDNADPIQPHLAPALFQPVAQERGLGRGLDLCHWALANVNGFMKYNNQSDNPNYTKHISVWLNR